MSLQNSMLPTTDKESAQQQVNMKEIHSKDVSKYLLPIALAPTDYPVFAYIDILGT